MNLTDSFEETTGVVASSQNWPEWWNWELDCSNPHLAKRMIDRSFSETELRDMLERAHSFEPDVAIERFIVKTTHESQAWEVVVEPDRAAQLLVVVTAYPVG
jgi:hypothetical protein